MVDLSPDLLKTLNLAMASHQAGNLTQAESLYKSVLSAKPDQFEALHFLGLLEAQRGRLIEADALIGRSLKVNTQRAEAFANHARVLNLLKRSQDALASADKALALQPYFPDALVHRGNALLELRRDQEALASYERALAIRGNDVLALTNRGNALRQLKRPDEALASYDRALALQPNFVDALANRGSLLFELARYDEAAAAYARVVALAPDYKYAQGFLVHSRMYTCDWNGLAENLARMSAQIRAGSGIVDPCVLLAVSSQPDEQLTCAKAYFADRYPAGGPLWSGTPYRHERIRLAYVCGEFREHPIACLIAGLLELHDKKRFETFGISTGINDRSAMRRRLEAAFDAFVEAAGQSDQELAGFMARSEIDIAVDLSGHFGTARPRVFALRPAPIQATYLGYPGTIGSACIDYIIADKTVIPEDRQSFYCEKIAWLPDQYQANDGKRAISEHTPTRTEAGLPERGFVFCCFNNNYKIVPDVFDVWMRLLQQVSGSVLWLPESNAAAARNLRAEGGRRGVEGERIVFAPRVPENADHLARLRLADLFLDTLPFNAHTTASDALWAGLPIVTCLGSTFAGRVAGSLLRSVGLPELITASLPEYEALALKLACDPALLADIKTRLARQRRTHALFDTRRFCRHIEQAYVTMWERHQRREPPASFAVAPID